MVRKIEFLWIISFLFFTPLANAQIQGTVLDEKGLPVEFVTVVLKNAVDSSFVAYTRTNEKGVYDVKPKATGRFLLSFSSLGFAKQEIDISVKDLSIPKTIDVVLKEETVNLDEVIVRAELDITKKKIPLLLTLKLLPKATKK